MAGAALGASVTAFDTALAFTLPAEGGYVDDPQDHGGATNHGVTQGAYDVFRDRMENPRRAVSLITTAEVSRLYLEDYWTPGHCDDLPLKLAVTHFDWCVNHGVPGALKTLQQTVGVSADGVWGPATATAVAESPSAAYYTYINARRTWYTDYTQSRPDQAKFAPGWMKRCDQLQKYVEAL